MTLLVSPVPSRLNELNESGIPNRPRSNSADITRPETSGDLAGTLSLKKGKKKMVEGVWLVK